jgi:hypothetical protein
MGSLGHTGCKQMIRGAGGLHGASKQETNKEAGTPMMDMPRPDHAYYYYSPLFAQKLLSTGRDGDITCQSTVSSLVMKESNAQRSNYFMCNQVL